MIAETLLSLILSLSPAPMQVDFVFPTYPNPCTLNVVSCNTGESLTPYGVKTYPLTHSHTLVNGTASYYDYTLKSGWTSKGHRVAASRDYPKGTTLRVTNPDNNKSVIVVVTDYGPSLSIYPDRIIDLSSHAFSLIANTRQGIIPVRVQPL